MPISLVLSFCPFNLSTTEPLARKEDLYPQAKQFKPERFLECQFAPYEFLPFGGGSRTCIGMAFAQFEMKLVLATVLSSWQLELADSKPVEPVRKGALLGPAQGVRIVLKGRRSASASSGMAEYAIA